ncbi:DNA glycosylase [Powellomyces hirtus]|nr:DNA glycosylase [Powellomyces hirtus]
MARLTRSTTKAALINTEGSPATAKENASVPFRKRKSRNAPDSLKSEKTAIRQRDDVEVLKAKAEANDEPNEGGPLKRSKRAATVKVEYNDASLKIEKPTKTKSSVTKKQRHIATYGQDPFPEFKRPTVAESRAVTKALGKLHGHPRRPAQASLPSNPSAAGCGQVRTVLDALIRTILSQNTTSANSTRAWQNLYARFGAGNGGDVAMFDNIRAANVGDVEEAIRAGGLAAVKSKVIYNVLSITHEKYGTCSLEHLREAADVDAMKELMEFDGVGPKTASCVLLFCLRRESFAVDTHVFRISKALNWVPAKADREQAQAHLDACVPEDIKYPLHCLLVTHGKSCKNCAANGRLSRPERGPCPLKPFLASKPKFVDVPEDIEESDADVNVKEDDEEGDEEDHDDAMKSEHTSLKTLKEEESDHLDLTVKHESVELKTEADNEKYHGL